MPCLNEERTLGGCIAEAMQFISKNKINAEVLVADNGSSDNSAKIAAESGARVVMVKQKGYGHAIRGGIAAAAGKYIIMGDCDGSYDFEHSELFWEALRGGADIVVGNRFMQMEKGAMPFWHKHLGVPLLSLLGRLKFRCSIYDFHCGLRGINRAAFKKLKLRCGGMEFATEMIAAASRAGYVLREVPTFYRRDKRNGRSHLRTVRDGMRHLVYILTA